MSGRGLISTDDVVSCDELRELFSAGEDSDLSPEAEDDVLNADQVQVCSGVWKREGTDKFRFWKWDDMEC